MRGEVGACNVAVGEDDRRMLPGLGERKSRLSQVPATPSIRREITDFR